MKNPFQYGGVVRGDGFCNRKKEVEDLLRAMENAEKLFVYSERRFGKTSLVRFALDKLSKKQYVSAYVDLWPTDVLGKWGQIFILDFAKKLVSSLKKLAIP
jgi:AAA+ ATPase superfamily predicted ATPase